MIGVALPRRAGSVSTYQRTYTRQGKLTLAPRLLPAPFQTSHLLTLAAARVPRAATFAHLSSRGPSNQVRALDQNGRA